MSGHTPGPLVRMGTRLDVHIGGFIAIGPSDHVPTAYVACGPDADLYIAAPEMLTALRLVHSVLMAGDEPLTDFATALSDAKALDAVIAAIAKAEGK